MLYRQLTFSPHTGIIEHMETNLEITTDGELYQGWLVVDGENVGYIYGKANSSVELWTIETKAQYRNQGFAKMMIDGVKSNFEVDQIIHTGSFTPEGSNFVSAMVVRPAGFGEAHVDPEPMDFICDWEERRKHTGHCGH